MLDNLTSHNHTDFKQRYQGTFGFLVQKEKKHLVYLNHVDSDVAKFVDVAKNEYYVYSNSEHQFEFIQVTRGWFNTKTGLYYLTRIPARQWHRGICPSNTEIYVLNEAGISARGVEIKTLQAVFEQEETYPVAYEKFRNGKAIGGFALSRHFAITPKTLYFCNKIVGEVAMDGNIAIKLSNNLIYQELSDVVRRQNYSAISIVKKEKTSG